MNSAGADEAGAHTGVTDRVQVKPAGALGAQGAGASPAVVVEHLTKRFGERVAFEDVSFCVAYGEVFGFLGPNGAGKTTTVRVLGTLLAPTSGSAKVAGIPLRPENGEEIRQRIAIMPESPGLYRRLTVTENLEFFAGLYGLRDSRTKIGAALAAVNLTARANDPCGTLSKGLSQRVGWRVLCSTTRRCCSLTNQPLVSTLWPLAKSTS